MSKYSKDLDEDLVKKVKNMAAELNFGVYGIDVEAIRLKKTKNEVGQVLRGNDLVSLFTGMQDLIVIALYEEAFREVDEATQDYWIEELLSRVYFDTEKDKVIINKPEINISLGMYHKYGNIAAQKSELALLTVQQIAAKEKELKESTKKSKK